MWGCSPRPSHGGPIHFGSIWSFRWWVGLEYLWLILVVHLIQFCMELRIKGMVVQSICGMSAALAFTNKAWLQQGHKGSPHHEDAGGMVQGVKALGRFAGAHITIILTGTESVWVMVFTQEFEAHLFHLVTLSLFWSPLDQ